MKTSANGINLLCQFEGFRNTAYLDSVGVLTIGYGHTSMAGFPIVKTGMVISDQQGKDILAVDIVKYETAVLKVLTRIPNQNQFDAMVSLCYNIGPGNFASSTVVRQFNAGNMDAAANGFALWVHAGGNVLSGLVTRRGKEMALFKASEMPATAPSQAQAQPTSQIPQIPPKSPPVAPVGPLAAFLKLLTLLFTRKAPS